MHSWKNRKANMTGPVSFVDTRTINIKRMQGGKSPEFEQINNEFVKSNQLAREGVDVPRYTGNLFHKEWNYIWKCKGKPADFKENPLTEKHLNNLFKNLLILDTKGHYHTDLSSEHILFDDDKNQSVQINSLAFVNDFKSFDKNFIFDKEDFGRTYLPSNADNFEWMNFSQYINDIESYSDKYKEIEKYLKVKSDYCRNRAIFLEKNGFSINDKALRFEIIKEEIFKNPTSSLIRYTNDKLKTYNKRLEADSDWKNSENPHMRFNSVITLLHSAIELIDLKQKAQQLQKSSNDFIEKEYYKSEEEILDLTLEKILDEAYSKGKDSFIGKNYKSIGGLYLGNKYDEELFYELFEEIDNPLDKYTNESQDEINNDSEEFFDEPYNQIKEDFDFWRKERIYDVIQYYNNLIDDWDFDNNEKYKRSYLRNVKPSLIIQMPSGVWTQSAFK